jgi:AraC-like DNA-binding protein
MPRPHVTLIPCHRPGVQAVVADTSHRFGRHTHDQFGLGLIERGAQKSASGRGTVEACAGDLITVNPGEVHDGAPLTDGGRRWHMLYLDPAVVQALARDIADGDGHLHAEFTQPALRDARLAQRFGTLFRRLTDPRTTDTDLGAEEASLQLLAALMQRRPPAAAPLTAGLQAARARIDDDPAAAHTLATLAHEAGLSRYALVRSFARATGLTPHAYLVQRRLQSARRLIAQGLPLGEAALASGFADQSHLTRLFVRSYGLTPGAYARALR